MPNLATIFRCCRTTFWSCAWAAAMIAAVPVSAASSGVAVPDPDALIAQLKRAEYPQLDARVNQYLRTYEEDTDKESTAYSAIGAFGRSDAELEQHFNAWVAAYPKSYGARLARARYYLEMGWSRRGGQFAEMTANERFQAMDDYFDRSAADLRASLKLSSKPVLSYAYVIEIAMARGDRAWKKRLLDQALQLDPYNALARYRYMHSLRPEWGEGYDAMSAFIADTKRYGETPKLRQIVAKLEGDVLSRRAEDSHSNGDYQAAMELHTRALALSEDEHFLYSRALTLMQLDRHRDALTDVNRAIELNPNFTEAYVRRGEIYGKLDASDRLGPRALADFRVAAERGEPVSQSMLAWAYGQGAGVPANDQEAIKWLRLAANQGDAYAQTWLGSAYREGKGVPKDDREGLKWLRRAANQGSMDAQTILGLSYFTVTDTGVSDQEAVKWLRLAANQGDDQAQASYAYMLSKGLGTAVNKDEAIEWWQRAARQGNTDAWWNLGPWEALKLAVKDYPYLIPLILLICMSVVLLVFFVRKRLRQSN